MLIKKEIGAGQFGTVHEAIWRGEKHVAVKMMKPDSMNTHDFIEEAKMMQYICFLFLYFVLPILTRDLDFSEH